MELDESYDLIFLHTEETVAKDYKDGIENISKSNDVKKNLETLASIFNSLGESHPVREQGIEWALEIIPAYRNLARILIKSFKELNPLSEDMNSLFSRYEDLLVDYQSVSHVGEGDPRFSQLDGALKALEKVKGVLEGHEVNEDGLESVFTRLNELEENVEQHNKKSAGLENL